MKKKVLALVMACAMSVTLLAGCGSGSSSASKTSSADSASSGGTLTVSLASSPSKLDPIHYSGTYEGQIIEQVCDRLIEYNDDLTDFVPSLATKWKISDNGLKYVFTIRAGVHFQKGKYQNGREMTADDVAYSLNRSAQHSDNNRLSMLKEATVTGKNEVTCTLKTANSAFMAALTDAGNSILPKEEVEGWGDDFGTHLIGTGPFYLEKFQLDEQAVLTANSKYFVAAPKLKKLVFKFISDPTQAANALLTGEVDIATDLAGEAINTVSKSSSAKILKKEAMQINYIRFNMKKGPTANADVRKAMIEAVDFDAVRSALYQYDEVKAAYLPLPYGSWGYDSSLESLFPGYNEADAKALIKKAGYANGFEVNIYVSNNAQRKTLATLLQAYWKKIGIKAKVNVAEWGTFSDTVCSGNADVYAMSWAWYPDPYFFLNKLFSSSETTAIGNGAGYVSTEVDDFLQKAGEATNQTERAKYYSQAMKKTMEDYAGIYYADPYVIYGVNGRAQGFVQRADGILRFVTSDHNVSVTGK